MWKTLAVWKFKHPAIGSFTPDLAKICLKHKLLYKNQRVTRREGRIILMQPLTRRNETLYVAQKDLNKTVAHDPATVEAVPQNSVGLNLIKIYDIVLIS